MKLYNGGSILAGLVVGQNAAPALADLDGDGDLDLAVGNYSGTFNYFENIDPLTATPDRPQPAAPLRLAAAPNPFNPATRIEYDLPTAASVTLAVFDVMGRRVRTLTDGFAAAGSHRAVWTGLDAAGAPVGAGVYFLKLSAGQSQRTIKLVLLK